MSAVGCTDSIYLVADGASALTVAQHLLGVGTRAKFNERRTNDDVCDGASLYANASVHQLFECISQCRQSPNPCRVPESIPETVTIVALGYRGLLAHGAKLPRSRVSSQLHDIVNDKGER